MKRRTFLSTTAVGSAALSGCLSALPSSSPDRSLPTTPGGTWTQHGADAANTFAPDVSAPPRGNLAWTSKTFTRWAPAVADGTVYTTNFDLDNEGSAVALDARDGSERWRTRLRGEVDHGRSLVDEQFVVAYDGELVALDRQSGDVAWSRPLNRPRASGQPLSLAVDEASGTVVVSHADGTEAYRADDGERRWEAKAAAGLVTPAIYGDTVYAVGRVDGEDSLVALALGDGTIRWSTTRVDPSMDASPVAIDQGVLIVDGNSLGLYDRETGARRTDLHSFETPPSTVAADEGTAFVATRERLLAVDIEAGTTRRLHDDGVYPDGLSVGTESVVAVVDDASGNDEVVAAIDRETGTVRWSYALDGFHSLTIPPVLADGAVFVATSRINALAALGDVPTLD